MGLAFTERPTVYGFIPAAPFGAFLDGFHTMALLAGWEWLGVYQNGNQYLLTSPQELAVQCRVWFPVPADTGYADCYVLQFVSASDPVAVQGQKHHFTLAFTGFPVEARFTEYAVWMNCCSVFLGARLATNHWNLPRAAQGGVPYVPNAIGATAPTGLCADTPGTSEIVTEMWWSAGDDKGAMDASMTDSGQAINFRNGHYCMRFSWCVNGTALQVETGKPTLDVEARALQLCILKSAMNWSFIVFPEGFLHFDDPDTDADEATPLAANPLLAFNAEIRAELYDACLLSKPMELEAEETIYESSFFRRTTWQNYTKGKGLFISSFDQRTEGAMYSLLLLQGIEFDEAVNLAY
jgi:hypothetical protein